MEPISRKAGAAGTAGARQALTDGQKSGPSKFDLLRSDLNQKLKEPVQLPPKVTSISDQQMKLLENDLRRKLEAGKNPQEVFAGDMAKLQTGIVDSVVRLPPPQTSVPSRRCASDSKVSRPTSTRRRGS
jgi:hypothetical protein